MSTEVPRSGTALSSNSLVCWLRAAQLRNQPEHPEQKMCFTCMSASATLVIGQSQSLCIEML